jgi:hypothetical protein
MFLQFSFRIAVTIQMAKIQKGIRNMNYHDAIFFRIFEVIFQYKITYAICHKQLYGETRHHHHGAFSFA